MLINSLIYVNTLIPVNEDSLIVNWTQQEETYDVSFTSNVVLAAYVTTIARLKLYNFLEQLDDWVLYYDTDSVIYVSKIKTVIYQQGLL